MSALIYWPSSLPQSPLLDGWQESPQDNVVSNQPEVGDSIDRPRATRTGWNVSLRFLMTDQQRKDFWTFYESTLRSGVLAFRWAGPPDKIECSWKFKRGETPVVMAQSGNLFGVSFNALRLP